MNSKIEKIYFNSPIFIQNIMTTIYGLYLHRQRYGGKSKRYTDEIKKNEYLGKKKLVEMQEKKFLDIIHHAYHNTDYYKKLFDKYGIELCKVNKISQIEQIPILEKEKLKENPESFLAKNIKSNDVFKLYTSGTTGKPLTIYCDKNSRRHNYAFFNRVRRWHGTKIGDRRATFYGRVVVPQGQKKPPFWRYDATENNYLFSSYHLSPENYDGYCKKLKMINPVEIRGYPSSLYSLALYMNKNNINGVRPKVVFTTAETLLKGQREAIKKAFGCNVIDTYGCTEMAFYITQCEYLNYHVHSDYGIVEIVKDGKKVENGGEGELVCTSFVNRAMPLIRYRINDTISLSTTKCKCGRNMPIVNSIVGRTDDIIVTPENKSVGRLDPIFKGGSGIRETQIIQVKKDKLTIKMVKDNDYKESDLNYIIEELKKRVGDLMKIDVVFCDEIPKGRNGKFRSVISLINKN